MFAFSQSLLAKKNIYPSMRGAIEPFFFFLKAWVEISLYATLVVDRLRKTINYNESQVIVQISQVTMKTFRSFPHQEKFSLEVNSAQVYAYISTVIITMTLYGHDSFSERV